MYDAFGTSNSMCNKLTTYSPDLCGVMPVYDAFVACVAMKSVQTKAMSNKVN